MEANDTVMTKDNLVLVLAKRCDLGDASDSWWDCVTTKDFLNICQAQAEISFKAGIKEVVEFIGTEPFEHNYSMYGHQVDDCFACKWQDQLKKWGIE